MKTIHQSKMQGKYQAVLFHPEGDYVTDFHYSETIEDVRDAISNMGARWIFYPLCFVATDKTIVDTCEGAEFLKGKRIKTLSKFFNAEWEKRADDICNLINDGAPFWYIYA